MALVWFSTPTGPIFSPDSVSYIRSLRMLQAGDGVLALDNHWPPGYPLLLSFMYSLVGSEMLAARLLSAVCLVLSLVALALFTSRLENLRSARLLLTLLVLVHLLGYGFSYLYLFVLSEPPFMAALCWALVAYQRVSADRTGYRDWLLLTASLTAMLLLRYTALPIVAAFLFSLALQFYLSGRRQLAVVLGVGLLSATPLITWLGLISSDGGGAVRIFRFHPLRAGHFEEFAAALARWMGGIDHTLAFVIYLAVLMTAAWLWLKTRRPELLLLLTWSAAYLLFLILSLLFFDAHTPLSSRIIFPLYSPFFLLLVCFCGHFIRSWRGINYSVVLAVVLIIIIGLGLSPLRRHLKASAIGAAGSAKVTERNLELYRRVAALSPDTPVYANTAEILFLFFRREVLPMPRLYDPVSMQQNDNFIAEMASMIEHMHVDGGVLLWMPVGGFRSYYPKIDVLLQFPLEIIAEADGGYLIAPDIAD